MDELIPGQEKKFTKRRLAVALGQDYDVLRKRVRDVQPLWIAVPLAEGLKRRGRRDLFFRFEDIVMFAIVATLKLRPQDVLQLNASIGLDKKYWQASIESAAQGGFVYVPFDGMSPQFSAKLPADHPLALALKIDVYDFAQTLRAKLEAVRQLDALFAFWSEFPRPWPAPPSGDEAELTDGLKVKAFRKR